MLTRFVAAVACLFSFSAHAQTGMSKSTSALTTEINTFMADNDVGAITPAVARQVLLDIINSYVNVISASSCANEFACLTILKSPAGITPPELIEWNASFVRIGNDATQVGDAVVGSANQFGTNMQIVIPVTASPASYEKAALFVSCWTYDISTPVITRDCVGSDTRGVILATNTLGRAWGGIDTAQIFPGGVGDGLLVGREIDIVNNGTDQPAVNTTTSKIGLAMFSMGTSNTTVGLQMAAFPTLFHKGIYSDPASFVTLGADPNASFIELNGRFKVQPNGAIVTSVPLAGTLALFQSSVAGPSFVAAGVLPAIGTNTDELDWNVNFATDTGTQYVGAGLDFNQLDATNAAPVTSMEVRLVTGARVSTHVMQADINNAGTAGGWDPMITNVLDLGHNPVRWNNLYARSANITTSITGFSLTTPPVAPAAGSGVFCMSSNTGLCIYMGAGTPSFSAAVSSLFINTAPTGTTSRLFINTTGSGGTWANFTASS